MKNMHNKILGKFGEDASCKHLCDKGYTIVRRNFRCRAGEVDIIAKHNDCLIFVEVKTRQSSDFGTPAEAVDFRKLQKIKQVVNYYLNASKWDGDVRVDAAEVYGTLELGRFLVSEINHIENITM